MLWDEKWANDTPLVIVFLNDMYFDILDLKNFIQYIYTCYGRLLGIWYLNPAFPKTEILLDVDIADKQIKIYNIFTSFIPMHTYTYLFCCIRHCVYYDRVIEKQFSYHSQSNNKNMNMSFFYWTLTEISFWIQKLSLPQNIFRLVNM